MSTPDDVFAASDFSALDTFSAEDQTAVLTTLGALLEGFQGRDAAKLEPVYADDADWVNAFGTQKRGRAAIVSYLHALFQDQNFDDGELVGPPVSRLRRLTAEVVTVSTHLQVTGQGLVDGGEIPLRDNFSLRILQRQDDGRWLIVSEMYNDANQYDTFAGHDDA